MVEEEPGGRIALPDGALVSRRRALASVLPVVMTGMTGLLPGGARAAVQSADFWARPRYVRVARP